MPLGNAAGTMNLVARWRPKHAKTRSLARSFLHFWKVRHTWRVVKMTLPLKLKNICFSRFTVWSLWLSGLIFFMLAIVYSTFYLDVVVLSGEDDGVAALHSVFILAVGWCTCMKKQFKKATCKRMEFEVRLAICVPHLNSTLFLTLYLLERKMWQEKKWHNTISMSNTGMFWCNSCVFPLLEK